MATAKRKKKMETLQNLKSSHIGSVIDYTPPRLHDGNDWYVDFYCYCPAQNKKRRKKIKLNFIEKIGDRRRYASNLIKKLHQKLEDGWNPWIEAENEKAYHTFADVLISKISNVNLYNTKCLRSI